MSLQIYMIFFLLQHTPARRQGITGTVSGCRDVARYVSTQRFYYVHTCGNAMWDFFRPNGGIHVRILSTFAIQNKKQKI